MPNWCECKLTITGSDPVIDAFLNACRGTRAQYALSEWEKRFMEARGEKHEPEKVVPFTFNALHPVPQDVLEKGYNDAGYHWQLQNWGTKWDVNGVEVIRDEKDQVILYFDTAWSPPVTWVIHVSTIFPELTFKLVFFEPGMLFCGHLTFQKGELIEEEYYEDDTEAFWNYAFNVFGYNRSFFFDDDDGGEFGNEDEPTEGSTSEVESPTA